MATSLQDRTGSNGQQRSGRYGSDGRQPADRLPVPRRPRRPVAIAAGTVLLVASSALGGALATRGSHLVAVLTLTRPLSAGQTLSAADLGVAHLSGSGVRGIAAADADRLVGQTALASLPAGTLLTPQMLSAASVPGVGQEVVAVAVKPGGFPPGLAPGRSVAVLQVAPTNGAGPLSPAVLVPSAAVLRVEADAATGTTVVALVVDAGEALSVSQASAEGAVSLALLPAGK